MITPATQQKRQDLLTFIEQELAPYAAVQAVIGVGSIATGLARPDSDIDAVIFLDPIDPYIVPAEFIWRPSDRTFHSIFSREPGVQEAGMQFDFARYDLRQWADPGYEWPEAVRGGLSEGWIAFDRGRIADLIAERTAYREEIRIARLDEALVELDLCLKWDEPQALWAHLGPATALDRLQAAYEALVSALFAYNRHWRPYRVREMSHLLKLAWLPQHFEQHILVALNAPSLDYNGYLQRFEALQILFDAVLAQLVAGGDYEEDAVSQAFIRTHEEPGRAWNMDAWNRVHHQT
jgi:hypothetical protein